MKLKTNELFGKYRLQKTIFDKEYFGLYEAVDETGKEVFLTIYDGQTTPLCLSDGLSIKEFQITKKLHDPVLPRYIEQSSINHKGRMMKYMVTAYHKSVTLREYISKNKPKPSIVYRIADHLVAAVAELHKNIGGGHYNITPDTVMISEDSDMIHVHLIELSHASGICNGKPDFDTSTLDPCFRAPETCYGMYGPSTDIYALGVLTVYMLNGSLPWEKVGKEKFNTVFESIEGGLPISDKFKNYLRQATSSAVSKRFSDVNLLSLALKSVKPDLNDANTFCSCYNAIISGDNIIDDSEEKPQKKVRRRVTEKKSSQKTEKPAKVNTIPDVHFGSRKGEGLAAVAGMAVLKKRLRRDFVDIVTHPTLAKEYNIQPPNIILYGPPGTGKTYLANRLAEVCCMEFCSVVPSDLGSIYIHGSQGLIKNFFIEAEEKAKNNKYGCMVFIDEIDAVCSNRIANDTSSKSDDVAEMLAQLNTCREKRIYVIGATNFIDRVDSALLRTGRMDSIIYIGMPDKECREELFKLEITNRPHEEAIDISRLAELTEGFTSSDIVAIVTEAARHMFAETIAIENDAIQPHGKVAKLGNSHHHMLITQTVLENIIRETRPSVSHDDLRAYERESQKYMASRSSHNNQIGFNLPHTVPTRL